MKTSLLLRSTPAGIPKPYCTHMKTIRLVLLASICIRLVAADAQSSGTISSGPFQLGYRIEGTGNPAIVVGSATYNSRIFSQKLRQHLKLVFLDHRVSAPSPGPVDVTEFGWDALLNDIELARKHLGLGRVAVIGHSGNGLIALEYAKKFPANTSHVILIGISPKLGLIAERERYWSESVSPDRKAAWEESQRRLPNDALAKLSRQERNAKAYIRDAPKIWYDPTFDATPLWQGVEVNMDAHAHVWGRLLREIDIATGLAAFDRPVLVALGRYDFVVPPPSSWDPLRPKFKDLTVRVFERSGHTPQYEEPELFDAELLRWIKEKSQSKPATNATQ